jgi:hypothetical protein
MNRPIVIQQVGRDSSFNTFPKSVKFLRYYCKNLLERRVVVAVGTEHKTLSFVSHGPTQQLKVI